MRSRITLLVIVAVAGYASTAFSSGYRIPEQSLNSTALSSAYVAHALNADAAYFNPANVSWLSPGTHIEGGLTYIHLPSISYDDYRSASLNSDSEKENFLVPNLHVVSPEYNNFRFGFALAFPAGLAKRWEDTFARTFANEFSMTVAEANPTVSYKFCDKFSAAVGARLVYSEAKVKSDGTIVAAVTPTGPEYTTISRDMDHKKEGNVSRRQEGVAVFFGPNKRGSEYARPGTRSHWQHNWPGDSSSNTPRRFPPG